MGCSAGYRVWPTVAPLTTVKHLHANLEQPPIPRRANDLFKAQQPHNSAIRTPQSGPFNAHYSVP
ncbi:hypothetical protein PMI23_03122 [Pseudomonas sp. GM24]|jgi:hypothetical protein|nr:hypothetical protein PMI19_02942 [Pseudomonas sp. GM16]EJM36495.1 hypothetical protein PMI23_03122 [Pseudomonas sp. GM24]